MLTQFNEVSATDNKVVGVVFINPRQVVKVARVFGAADSQQDSLVTLITDVNKQTVRVEGGPSTVAEALNRAGR